MELLGKLIHNNALLLLIDELLSPYLLPLVKLLFGEMFYPNHFFCFSLISNSVSEYKCLVPLRGVFCTLNPDLLPLRLCSLPSILFLQTMQTWELLTG